MFSLTLLSAAADSADAAALPVVMQWISALAPAVTAAAVIVAFLAYLQRRSADTRAGWWARAVKAIELMTTKDDLVSVNAGMALASRLADSKKVTEEDKQLFIDVIGTIADMLIEDETSKNERVLRERRARARRKRRLPWRRWDRD